LATVPPRIQSTLAGFASRSLLLSRASVRAFSARDTVALTGEGGQKVRKAKQLSRFVFRVDVVGDRPSPTPSKDGRPLRRSLSKRGSEGEQTLRSRQPDQMSRRDYWLPSIESSDSPTAIAGAEYRTTHCKLIKTEEDQRVGRSLKPQVVVSNNHTEIDRSRVSEIRCKGGRSP
jgi:hypothetical protein